MGKPRYPYLVAPTVVLKSDHLQMDNAIGDDPCAVAGRLNSPCVEDPSSNMSILSSQLQPLTF